MAKQEELSRIDRRALLVRSVKRAVAGAGAIVVAAQGGRMFGAKEEKEKHLSSGDLTPDPELRKKLTDKNHSVVKIQGWTAASLREAKLTVPDFPSSIPGGDSDLENTPSEHEWIAVVPGGIYLPREENNTVGDLAGDLRTANTAAGRIDSNLRFVSGDLSDFLEAELASLRSTGQSLFQAGHVVTTHQVEIGGITNGIAIGRSTPTDPLSIISFDASPKAPLPAGVSAGGFVVAK